MQLVRPFCFVHQPMQLVRPFYFVHQPMQLVRPFYFVHQPMQLVRPKVVAMAVRMEMIMLIISFQVSFLLSCDIVIRF